MVYLQKYSSLVDTICNTVYNSISTVIMVILPSIPQQWKGANIVTIFKRKGTNLSAVIAGAYLYCLYSWEGPRPSHATLTTFPRSRCCRSRVPICGFRRNRSTVDMIYCTVIPRKMSGATPCMTSTWLLLT